MPQKYYSDNIIGRFIKALLWDSYLPICNVWKPGKSLIKGLTYITFDKNIVIAKKDFNPNTLIDEGPTTSNNSEYFKYIGPYVENEFYPGVTSNFQSNSNLYDSETHYYLGQYLRFIRDIKNINLMPYYNCFSGLSSDKLRIDKSYLETNNTIKDDYITYIVNIDFNQEYTIYYNSNTPIYILPVYYDEITCYALKDTSGINYNPIIIRNCSFNQPYLYKGIAYSGDEIPESDVQNNINTKLINKYIKLLIQVPINNSNLVVLEGNYLNKKLNLNKSNKDSSFNINKVSSQYFGDIEEDKSLDINELLTVSYPSLLRNVSNVNNAFSDRLVEYLLYSPIIKGDRIANNIKRIQECLSSEQAIKVFGSKYSYLYKKDIWDDKLRIAIYNNVTQNSKVSLFEDINGFVDKDSEFLIEQAKPSEEIF